MVSVIGEALIDLVRVSRAGDGLASGPGEAVEYRAHPGGSPFNVAIGLARLGQHALLQARFGDDAFGRQLYQHAAANGVDLSRAIRARESSTLAVVGINADGNASYDFYLNGTADWQWTEAELAQLPDSETWVHTGSLASWTDPGASVIETHLRRLRATRPVVVSYDPNVRPRLMPDHAQAVAAVERMVALAHVVKASAEDLTWLYPGRSIGAILHAWRDLGPTVVVVTDGGTGAHLIGADGHATLVPARPVSVVDTVGAGDAFMSGLISGLSRAADLTDADAVQAAVAEAIMVAALTVGRAGANPPTADELAAALALS